MPLRFFKIGSVAMAALAASLVAGTPVGEAGTGLGDVAVQLTLTRSFSTK